MSEQEARKLIIEIIKCEDVICAADILAREYAITLTEVWEDGEIIGIAVDDEVIYF